MVTVRDITQKKLEKVKENIETVKNLGVPNYYLLEGGIKHIPYDSFSNFPFMAEMLYTLGMFLSGLKLAQFTSVLIFILSALLIYDFCRIFILEIHPAIPALFYLVTPAFMEITIYYTNDLHFAYYTLLIIYCFFLWNKTKKPGLLILTGIFTGIWLSTKYTALPYVPALLIMGITSIILNHRKDSVRSIIIAVSLCVIPALILYMPWLIKNFLNTGNPLYPALYNLLGGKDMSADQYHSIMTMSHHPSIKEAAAGLIKHPLNLFLPHAANTDYGAGSNLGPLILIFGPSVLLVKDICPVIKKTGMVAAILFIIWDITFLQVRFLYPAIIMLLIVSAYGFSRIFQGSSPIFKGLITAGAAGYLFLNLSMGFYQLNLRTQTYGMDFCDETDEKYLMRQMIDGSSVLLFSLPIYNYINNKTDEHALVLIIGDAQHLYLKRRHLYTYLSASTPFDVFKYNAGRHEEIAKALRADGITHIVYNPIELVRLQRCGAISFPEKNNAAIDNFLQSRYVRQIKVYKRSTLNVYLYELSNPAKT